jgi:uncharacterized protein YggE
MISSIALILACCVVLIFQSPSSSSLTSIRTGTGTGTGTSAYTLNDNYESSSDSSNNIMSLQHPHAGTSQSQPHAQQVPPTIPSPSQKAEATSTLTSVGHGIVTIDTDMAQISVTIESKHQFSNPIIQNDETQQQMADASAKVLASLSKKVESVVQYLKQADLHVTKLKTASVSLYPQNTWRKDREMTEGFIGQQSLNFRVPTQESSAVISGVIQHGATRIDSISFVASDEKLENARHEAIQQATRDALKQLHSAITILQQYGTANQQALYTAERQVIKEVRVNSVTQPTAANRQNVQPMVMMKAQAMAGDSMAASPTMPIEGGEQQVQSTVTVTITYT